MASRPAPGAVINLPSGTSPVSFEVTNTTYIYLSMTHGDGFAKQFTTGDFFELKIFGYSGLNGGGTQVGEVDFFLANYTSANSLPVDVWTLVDLTSLAGSQSLSFDYASSDVGQFGINTPEYFAMDDLTLSTAAGAGAFERDARPGRAGDRGPVRRVSPSSTPSRPADPIDRPHASDRSLSRLPLHGPGLERNVRPAFVGRNY